MAHLSLTSKYKLTGNQKAIWLESGIHPCKPIFNIGTYTCIKGKIDEHILQEAIQKVIDQNDAMRMRLQKTESGCVQYFEEKRTFKLSTKYFQNEPDGYTKAWLWMKQEFVKPIDIYSPTLYKIALVQYKTDEYVLCFKYHHIFIDGWARALVVQKIAQQYNALLQREEVSNYSSYAQFVSKKENEELDKLKQDSIKFWKQTYQNHHRTPLFAKKEVDKNNLPSSRKRFALEREIFNNIKVSGYAEHKAKFYYLLASLYITLSQSLGKKEIVIGIPLLNRFTEEEKNTIGYYIGLMPLKLSFTAKISFKELIDGIRKQMGTTLPHRNISIQEINKALGINFSNSTQLYDVVFSYENHDHNLAFGSSKIVDAGTFSSDYEQNPLVIHVQNFVNDDNVNIEFDYNFNYLSTKEAGDLISRYSSVLKYYLQNQNKIVSKAPVLFEEEILNLKRLAQGTKREPEETNLAEVILKIANQNPNKTAVSDQLTSITYNQLITKAKGIASQLMQNGVGKGEVVAVFMPRSADAISAIAGIILSGACYLPIDTSLPEKRIEFMLSESDVKYIVVSSNQPLAKNIKQYKIVDVNAPQNNIAYNLPQIQSNNFAYVIFTSGTTGHPKGVAISHISVLNLLDDLNNQIFSHYPQTSKLALISSINFDASVQNIFACLLLGLELHIVPEECRKDGKQLVSFLIDNKIDICDGIPTHLNMIMSVNKSPSTNFKVKHFIIGGETFTVELAKSFFEWTKEHNVSITNVYGPTECTVDATYYTFNKQNADKYDYLPIGRPVQNCSILIMDENKNIVPPGVVGEIFIGGAGLSKGYINQEELTKQRFKHHDFISEYLYQTGDLGHWNEDGLLIFKGRTDSQIKLRGYRIELAEIEHYLREVAGADQAMAFVKKEGKQEQLIGAIQCKKELEEKTIKQKLEKYLPFYMIPHFIHSCKKFPITTTGKIDRKKLTEQLVAKQTSTNTVTMPATKREEELAVIWKDVLGLKMVDVKESFFIQGGDSLSLMYLLSEIEKNIGVELSMRQFANMNTIREIAKYIDLDKIKNQKPISLKKQIKRVKVLKELENNNEAQKREIAFLTGATGFVGAFILHELQKSFKKTYCLVRGKNEKDAVQKLENAASKYRLKVNWDKVEIIKGDLSKKRVGLNEVDYELIKNKVDVIFHCGASVNFMADFESMKATNIKSTVDLLKICKIGKRKQFNYISTIGVFSKIGGRFAEEDTLSTQIHYKDKGYESTKWVADGIVQAAGKYGVNCNIYRLGRITGDAENGIANFDDFFYRFIEGCLTLGSFPDDIHKIQTDLTPVDISAKAIVYLSEVSDNQTFHIVNPHATNWSDLLKYSKNYGLRLNLKPYDEWMKGVVELNAHTKNNPLYIITPILKLKEWFNPDKPQLLSEKTTEILKDSKLTYPKGDKLWNVYLNCCSKRINYSNFSL